VQQQQPDLDTLCYFKSQLKYYRLNRRNKLKNAGLLTALYSNFSYIRENNRRHI